MVHTPTETIRDQTVQQDRGKSQTRHPRPTSRLTFNRFARERAQLPAVAHACGCPKRGGKRHGKRGPRNRTSASTGVQAKKGPLKGQKNLKRGLRPQPMREVTHVMRRRRWSFHENSGISGQAEAKTSLSFHACQATALFRWRPRAKASACSKGRNGTAAKVWLWALHLVWRLPPRLRRRLGVCLPAVRLPSVVSRRRGLGRDC